MFFDKKTITKKILLIFRLDKFFNSLIMRCFLLFCFLISTLTVFAQRKKLKNVYENDYKIGIGTKYPDQLLTVKGTIHSQEVIVDLKGAVAPDYVFENYYLGTSVLNCNYQFMSLPELEKYISLNHHLPKVPSAKEMEENGLSLKEMNLLLLEKIEELTLHTIQQQKELDALKERLQLLEN